MPLTNVRPTVAAIIPAYNEAMTIAEVVRPLKESQWIDQVIVVSDGSTDDTKAQAEKAGACVYELSRCGGKGEAMWHGVMQATSEILVFFDGDLLGLTSLHVEQLLHPVITNECGMSVSIRDRGPFFTLLARHLLLISGERAVKRSIFEAVPRRFARGFMIEGALNYYCRAHNIKYCAVPLPGLKIRRKYQKVSWQRAIVQYLCMFYAIGKAMFMVRFARLFGQF